MDEPHGFARSIGAIGCLDAVLSEPDEAGVLGPAVLILHTGMHLGVGLNRLLTHAGYLGLGLAGGLMGLMIGLGGNRGPRQRAQRIVQGLHLRLFWLFPVLLLFHILAVYHY